MNIIMKNSVRYCGNSTLSAITALAIGEKYKQDAVIVTQDLEPYKYLFNRIKVEKDILISEQTKELAILKLKELDDEMKCYCIPVGEHTFILHLDNKQVIESMTVNTFQSKAVFIYDCKDLDVDTRKIKLFVHCFLNEYTMKKEVMEAFLHTQDELERKYRTMFICNRFLYGWDNKNVIAADMKLKKTDIIYFYDSNLLKKHIREGKLIDFVRKVIDKEPFYELYASQVDELLDTFYKG